MSLVINDELYADVDKAIDTIRPYLIADGGNARVVEITEEGVVKLELLGTCGSCSMAPMTLKAGVEEAIKKALPQITSVEAINLTELGI